MAPLHNLLLFPRKTSSRGVVDLIKQYKIPPYPKNSSFAKSNRALNKIPHEVTPKYAITTNKTIIKSFPTNQIFKNNPKDKFNRHNQTALHINSSIIILHYSQDHKWAFILSEIYTGWIDSTKFQLTNYQTFKENLTRKFYITITDPLIIYQNYYIDMGTKLPFIKVKNQITPLLLTNNGYIKLDIKPSSFTKNSLPLTKQNLHHQALKYIDYTYDLGDNYTSIDCSSFIRNIFLTCAKKLPRDTLDIYNSLKTNLELNPNSPEIQILHFKSHIALYLYTHNNKHYYIHANATHMKVTIDYLNKNYLNIEDLIGITHI